MTIPINYNFAAPLPPQLENAYDGIDNSILTNGLEYPVGYYRRGYTDADPTYNYVDITNVENGDQVATLSFTVLNATDLTNYKFAAYVDGIYYGAYRAYQEAGWIAAGFGKIVIGGLVNNEDHQIQLQALYVTYNLNGTLNNATRGLISNQVMASPTPNLANHTHQRQLSEFENGNIISLSVGSFTDSNFNYSSQYNYGGNSYDPIPFNPNVSIGAFNAKIYIDTRLIDSAIDGTNGWFVDYSFTDIDVKVLSPYNILLGTDGNRGIASAFNAARDSLGKNNPNMDIGQERIIEYHLRRQYVKAEPFLNKKIKKMLMENQNVLMRSLPTYRSFLNLLTLATRDVKVTPKILKISYIGSIFVNPKIIAAHHSSATAFGYTLKNSRGKNLKQGQNNLAISINYPQNFSCFSYLPLYSVRTPEDVLGNPNMTDTNP
jgi:hypothetical protein